MKKKKKKTGQEEKQVVEWGGYSVCREVGVREDVKHTTKTIV